LKIISVGNSAGVIGPKEMLAKLGVTSGDAEVGVTLLASAAGELTAEELAAWYRGAILHG
jgi:antitoxin component of MazEF toxin-antitoxin module